MPDPKMTAGGADDIRAQAEAQAQERERTRIKDLHAAFPDRPQFVMEQVLKGNSLAQAKAELADVLAAENKTLTDENAELKARAAASKVQPPAAQSKPVAGAPPISQEGSGSQAPAGSFLDRVTALAKERGITKRQAMSVLASEEPELFDKFREKCIAEGPAHADRKRRLGVS